MKKITKTETKYGLYHKKENRLLTYDVERHGRDFSTGAIVVLNTDESNVSIWLVDHEIKAEYARHFSTPWYNSTIDTPSHNFKPEELITVKVETIQIIESVDVKIPTVEEFIKEKYDNPRDKYHYTDLLERIGSFQYSFYDLYFLLEARKKKK